MRPIYFEEIIQVLEDARSVIREENEMLSSTEWHRLHQRLNQEAMQLCNGILQRNLNNWSFEQTAEYGRRIILYSRINEYFQNDPEKEIEPQIYQEALEAASLLLAVTTRDHIERLGDCELSEFKSILMDRFLPHYLVYKFVEESGADAGANTDLTIPF